MYWLEAESISFSSWDSTRHQYSTSLTTKLPLLTKMDSKGPPMKNQVKFHQSLTDFTSSSVHGPELIPINAVLQVWWGNVWEENFYFLLNSLWFHTVRNAHQSGVEFGLVSYKRKQYKYRRNCVYTGTSRSLATLHTNSIWSFRRIKLNIVVSWICGFGW